LVNKAGYGSGCILPVHSCRNNAACIARTFAGGKKAFYLIVHSGVAVARNAQRGTGAAFRTD